MNTNINRHRSPTQKSTQPTISKNLNYLNYNSQVQKIDKNNMHSSTQESTKQDQSSKQQLNTVKEAQYPTPHNLGFYKVKKQQIILAKAEANFHGLKTYHSEKVFHTKIQNKANQTKPKISPEKHHDYFGFKNPATKILKQKGKIQHKLSDSGQSEVSHNSTQSNNVENKAFKFFTKKFDKKHSQENFHKIQKYRFTQQPQKHVPLFLQQRAEHKKILANYSTRNQALSNQQTARKQSPSNHRPLQPSKKQDISSFGNDNGIYKRSSLTPQNKMQIMRHAPPEQNNVIKNLTPKKFSPLKYIQKQRNPSKIAIEVPKNNKNTILQQYQPKQKKLQKNSDFSFSKQRLQMNIPKFLNGFPTLTIYSVSLSNSSSCYPTTFILLQTLTQNRSSSIYKVLHPITTIVFCLKKCSVNKNNIGQLIIQHKVGTSLIHSNLVRAYTSFYDHDNIYLLMEYMQGRSLLNRANRNFKDKQISKGKDLLNKWDQSIGSFMGSKSSLQAKHINRMSIRQKPKFLQNAPEARDEPRHQDTSGYSPSYNNHPFSFNFHQQKSLQNQVQKQTFIKTVLQQILQGLRFLHQNNIIHRDLKPDNIFVSHNSYKIGDFGSCTYNNSQQYIGTLDYAAPQIMLRKNYDKSIDLWSLGCLAYQLDVGRPPFYHHNRNQTIRRITNVQYDQQLISDIGLRKYIGKLLLKNGNMRIDANQALMEIKMLQFVYGNNNNNVGGNSINGFYMGFGSGRQRISGK